MIDLEKIRRERTWKRILIELLVNALELFLMLYGLKCIVTLHGKMPLTDQGTVFSSLQLVPVSGTAAVPVGLLYVMFGLFVYLSDGNPPGENRGWLWRLGRGLLRWGSLAVALFCFLKADQLVAGRGFNLAGLPLNLLIKIVTFIVGVITLLSFLSAMFQREQVKRELHDRGCKPLHIQWRPAAYWICRFWFTCWSPTGFWVIYSDARGSIHKAYCFVYRSFLMDWRWGNRRVRWLADIVTSQLPAAEVWVDDEIMRPKLKKWDDPAEASNPLGKPNEPSD